MKAKELAEELLKYPDFDVEFTAWDNNCWHQTYLNLFKVVKNKLLLFLLLIWIINKEKAVRNLQSLTE